MQSHAKPGHILVYGLDSTLLDTRRMLLEHLGFRVEIARDFDTLRNHLSVVAYDLLILCHTVPDPQQHQIIEAEGHCLNVYPVPVLLQPETFLSQVQQLVR